MKKDKYGHMVSDKGIPMTDPYGELEFAVGSKDDFVCFDYAFEEDKCILHAVLNSETGHFIQDFRYEVAAADDSPYKTAIVMVEEALDWCAANNVKHDKRGWNQDPYYFARAVKRAYLKVNGLWGNDEQDSRLSERQFRLGGIKIDRWVGMYEQTPSQTLSY